MIVIEAQVFFTAPDHLDGLADFLRENGCFGHIVRLRLTPEGSAQQRHMSGDVFLVDAERGSDGFENSIGVLRGRPGFHLAVLILGNGDGRLHGSVSQQGRVVLRFDDLRRFSKRGIDVADVADHLLRFFGSGDQLLFVGVGLIDGVWNDLRFDL